MLKTFEILQIVTFPYQDLAPFGRRTYVPLSKSFLLLFDPFLLEDYFLQFVGRDRPGTFLPSSLEVNSIEHPFGEVLLNFRVALAAQCIAEPKRRPSDPRPRLLISFNIF